MAEFKTCSTVKETLKQQVLSAVDPIYYQDLEDDTFGYADVLIPAIIHHLTTTYGTLTASDLEINRDHLTKARNPGEPIENLWKTIKIVRAIATQGAEPISDGTTIQLTLCALGKTGVHSHAIETWYDKDDTNHTWPNFLLHFNKHEKTRISKLMAQAAGFHGAANATRITLNLLRGSRINPKLSAWAQVHGTFDFKNRTPLGPPGCRVLAHEKPDKHKTWAPHGLDGWYVGPALKSYRCYNIWIWVTRAIRIIDTLTWFPTKVKLPDSSSTDVIVNCLQDILHALKNPAPKSPLAPRTGTQSQALHDLVTLLGSLPAQHHAPVAPLPMADSTPPTAAAPLRVQSVPAEPVLANTPPPLRVETPDTVPNLIPLNDSPPDGPMIDEIIEAQYEAKHGHLSSIPFGFDGCTPAAAPEPPALRVLPTASEDAAETISPTHPTHSPPAAGRRTRPH
jgi:hypothetical protein